MRVIRRLAAVLSLGLALAGVAAATADAESSRACQGTITRQLGTDGPTLKADRIRAQGGTSCAYARYLIRVFFRAQLRDIECAGAAAQPGYACLLLDGQYEATKSGRRAAVMNQGWGVTFRERDYSAW